MESDFKCILTARIVIVLWLIFFMKDVIGNLEYQVRENSHQNGLSSPKSEINFKLFIS